MKQEDLITDLVEPILIVLPCRGFVELEDGPMDEDERDVATL